MIKTGPLHLLLIDLIAGHKAVRQPDETVVIHDKITCNASIIGFEWIFICDN